MKLIKREINNNNREIYMINKIDTNDRKRKIRNPGIDSVKVLAMYAIIIHHILLHAKVYIKYNKYKEIALMNISSFWHVSSYALVSGYIGYKSHKYSNLLYLWLCVLFYSLCFTYIFGKIKLETNAEAITFKDYFPVNFGKYWYFTKYFGMYLFLPVINKGISNLSKSELRIVVISLILIYIILKDIINPGRDIYVMNYGYSVLWLLIYYITGAYIEIYKKEYHGIKNKITLFIIYIFVFNFSTYLCFKLAYYQKGYLKILKRVFAIRINSFPMIIQSISITLLLTQIKYNKYLAKIITFLGPLTFGIYLVHENPIFRNNVIKQLFIKDSYNLSLYTVIKLVLIRGLKVFIFSIIVDYFRNKIFVILRLRKICIFFENCIFKFIN